MILRSKSGKRKCKMKQKSAGESDAQHQNSSSMLRRQTAMNDSSLGALEFLSQNARSLDEKEYRRALWESFDYFDKDHDGCIDTSELYSVFQALGRSDITEEQAKLMISKADTDGNGTVEYNEFLSMMKNYGSQSESSSAADIKDAFFAFDHNRDGFIDFSELKSTMLSLGESVTDADVNVMLREADTDRDGRINYEEFGRMMHVLRQNH